MKDRKSPADRITASIIEQLEQGVRPWTKPWASKGGESVALPLRANGEPYQGINVVMLWLRGATEGYSGSQWMTYRQAAALGGQVRAGEKSTLVVYYGQSQAKGEPDTSSGDADARSFRFLKGYPVFNVEQIDGLDAQFYPTPVPAQEPDAAAEQARIASVEEFIAATGAQISWSGDQAYYAPGPDHIRLPERHLFRDIEQAYATAAHELIHWTGAKHRQDRTFGSKFGDPAYAREELVAELGSAFLGAHLGLRPDHIEDHAAYLDHWLKVLRTDSRAILRAASQAQAATDYLLAIAGRAVAPVMEDLAEAA
jgi:antirestriction protein ArdC